MIVEYRLQCQLRVVEGYLCVGQHALDPVVKVEFPFVNPARGQSQRDAVMSGKVFQLHRRPTTCEVARRGVGLNAHGHHPARNHLRIEQPSFKECNVDPVDGEVDRLVVQY
ncbi:hypothetical protein D3C71_1570900 [compost metagenome]